MKILLRSKHPDLLAEGPYGERPPIYNNALVLAEGAHSTPGPDEPARIHDLGYARAMRLLANKADSTSIRNAPGPFEWEHSPSRAWLKVKLPSGKMGDVETTRSMWRLSSHQGGGCPPSYFCVVFAEPWPGDNRRVDIVIPALAKPHDFGLWYGYWAFRSAWALGACLAKLIGGKVIVE